MYGSLPREIFLDKHDSYTFKVIITPSSHIINLESIQLAFSLDKTKYVKVSSVRTVKSIRRIIYEVNCVLNFLILPDFV